MTGRAALALLCACSGVEQSYVAAASPDEALFAADVEPVLERHCANPSCHGRDERPLRVYAPMRFRVDRDRLFLDEPLSDDEVRANYESAAGFVATGGDPERSLLLRKPLGKAWHAPGAVFFEEDPPARAIRDWLWSGE
jgi:hypothetical protein